MAGPLPDGLVDVLHKLNSANLTVSLPNHPLDHCI